MTKSAVSNAKKIATKFFGSEMTPPSLELFQKFIDNGMDRRPLFLSVCKGNHPVPKQKICFSYLICFDIYAMAFLVDHYIFQNSSVYPVTFIRNSEPIITIEGCLDSKKMRMW